MYYHPQRDIHIYIYTHIYICQIHTCQSPGRGVRGNWGESMGSSELGTCRAPSEG